jgi:hypothetical protein
MDEKLTFHLSTRALEHFKGTLPDGTTSLSFEKKDVEEKPWGWLCTYQFEDKKNRIALFPAQVIRITLEN